LQYQIENTGLKSFRLLLPTNAEGARFQGDQVGDFLPQPGGVTNGLQIWEVKLRRRVIGPFLLQVSYQTPLPEQAAETTLRGIQAMEVNLQRGFVTVQSDPRLEVVVDPVPPSLQPAEWQSIPLALQKDAPSAPASLTYRLVEPSFQLPLKLLRHAAARLLPARVNSITLNSVVSDDGVMLTRASLEIVPGDKRLLGLTLPPDGRFWFAFVNDNGVWPWRDGGRVLIPLEQQAGQGKPATVDIYYGCRTGTAAAGRLNLELAAPKFDLPLENITWRIALGGQWRVRHHGGALQLQERERRRTRPARPLILTAKRRSGRRGRGKRRSFWPWATVRWRRAIRNRPGAPSRRPSDSRRRTRRSTRTRACNCTTSSCNRPSWGSTPANPARPATPGRWGANCGPCATGRN
jgi:hypothetical protein